jgi:hypothetical protein
MEPVCVPTYWFFFRSGCGMVSPAEKEERLTYLLGAFDFWCPKFIDNQVSSTLNGLVPSQEGYGLRINETALLMAVERHFASVDSFKVKYNFPPGARLNPFKVGAFTMYWLSKIRPIHDTRDENLFGWANEEFAIAVGLGMAGIDVNLRVERNWFHYLRTSLQTSCLSPESLVLVLMSLATKAECNPPC